MSLKQVTVFVENKQGALVSITDTLAKHNVNIAIEIECAIQSADA